MSLVVSFTIRIASNLLLIALEWASGDTGAVIQWESNTRANIRSHKFYRREQKEFEEINDKAAWGNWTYTTDQVVSTALHLQKFHH